MKRLNPAWTALSRLSNRQIMKKGDLAVQKRHELAIEILDCLIEIDRRSLYLKEGYSSLFDFCLRRWHYSRPKAGRTIAVARCMKNFPAVRTLLVEQKITVCGVALIAGILTEKNVRELLREVSGKTYTKIEKIAASFRTVPKIREFIRPIGMDTPAGPKKSDGRVVLFGASGQSDGIEGGRRMDQSQFETDRPDDEAAPVSDKFQFETDRPDDEAASVSDQSQFETGRPDDKAAPVSDQSQFETGRPDDKAAPVSDQSQFETDLPTRTGRGKTKTERRYEIRFSASEGFLRKLEQARAICSRRPSLEAILEKGLDELLERYDPERKQARREKRKSRKWSSVRSSQGSPGKTRDQKKRNGGVEPFGGGESGRESSERTDHTCGVAAPNAQSPVEEGASAAGRNGRLKGRSRHIPTRIRDLVFMRDGGRCTYIGESGIRCKATAHLQIDHIKPFCRGGEHTLDNLRVLCGKHNRLMARELSLSP